jgi:uncharacterized hydantoinase/oxoprolinase family protein
MMAADGTEFGPEDAVALAESVARAQAALVACGIRRVTDRMSPPPQKIILSGHGDFLAAAALAATPIAAPLVHLSQELDPVRARVGPAHALAVLAREGLIP